MIRPPVEANLGLAAVLRGVIADFQHASGADIVSVFLYEESTHTYYAPFAIGQPQESLLDSLTDMRGQLARYLDDERQGKVPDELGVHQYGSTVWLTVTRQRLVARNAQAEIDSTFIRRYQVQSTIGLPLLVGERLLGLIYLNFRNREKAPDDNRLRELERRAGTAAALIQSALEGAERTALEGLSRLTALLTTRVGDSRTDAKELRRLLSIALADLLAAGNLDCAAIYQFVHQRSHLELVTAHLRVAAPMRVERADTSASWEAALSQTVGDATAESDLHPVATYALGQPDEPHGYLIVVSRDRLATVRRARSTDEMLQAGAQLIGSALASQRLIGDLENSNRLLSALGDMTAAMLKPGATRHQVIDAMVGHLTDSEVPEFDFNFATVYLLEERDDEVMLVRMAAGAAPAATIEGTPAHAGKRVPRWALEEDRALAEGDVLVYGARRSAARRRPRRRRLGRHPRAVGLAGGAGRLFQRHGPRQGAGVPHRREGPASDRRFRTVHAGRRDLRARRAQGPGPDLRPVRQRLDQARDRGARGRLSPLRPAAPRLGADRGPACGGGPDRRRGRDRPSVRGRAAPRRAARARRGRQQGDRQLDRPGADPDPRRPQPRPARRCLAVPDRAVRRGPRGLVRRRRVRPRGPVAARARGAVGDDISFRHPRPRAAGGHRRRVNQLAGRRRVRAHVRRALADGPAAYRRRPGDRRSGAGRAHAQPPLHP